MVWVWWRRWRRYLASTCGSARQRAAPTSSSAVPGLVTHGSSSAGGAHLAQQAAQGGGRVGAAHRLLPGGRVELVAERRGRQAAHAAEQVL